MARAGYPAWDEDEAFFDERPAHRVRKRRLPWFRMIFMSSLMIGGLVYLAQRKGSEVQVAARKSVPASVLIAPAPAWTPAAPTPAPYVIERASAPPIMEARQHTSGAREDTLTLGRFGDAPYARLILIQGSSERARSFFVDIVRRAAEAGLAVSRNEQSRMVATKFGLVEAAAMTLVGKSEQECQTFRFADPDLGFGIQGWMCGSDAAIMDDAQLACFIDGITLAGASSPSLKALFVRAEKSRTEACGVAARTASTGIRPPHRP
ncbi:hypothetical protein DC522_10330 [Microvirga sp. KLBC 81]|uniref:hypothetical protein n=1 Tax=Microvirga sp. KLBC 81 TaxID=1862707 RepID=UPI000D510BC9|nr:hypothetical protein [Microvirga sp. KLBC 81]PVE24476.1 hypothetical protein DC522_10330 [Microvirga sp. KLBC 81]